MSANPLVLELTDTNFEETVVKSDLPVLVDFWAPWCGPCRQVAPSIDALATEWDGKIKVGKVNTDEAGDVASKFGIRSIPTLMVFKGGEVVATLVGALPKDKISEQVLRVL